MRYAPGMRHLIAAFVAAIVVFFWGFMSWAAIGVWDFAFPKPANEPALVEAMQSSFGGDGAYVVPFMPEGYGQDAADEAKKAEFADYDARHRAGVILATTSVASVHEMIASAQNAATNASGIRMKLPITP